MEEEMESMEVCFRIDLIFSRIRVDVVVYKVTTCFRHRRRLVQVPTMLRKSGIPSI